MYLMMRRGVLFDMRDEEIRTNHLLLKSVFCLWSINLSGL